MRSILLLALSLLSIAAALPKLDLLDLSGANANPFSSDSRATVFLFVSVDCPISNSYAPEFRRLVKSFQPLGISFYLIYPNQDETPDSIRKHLKEYDLPLPALRNPKLQLTKAANVRVTPEAA